MCDRKHDPLVYQLRVKRMRQLWLVHLQAALEGRDDGLIELLLEQVILQVSNLETQLRQRSDWYLIQADLEEEEQRDFMLLTAELYAL